MKSLLLIAVALAGLTSTLSTAQEPCLPNVPTNVSVAHDCKSNSAVVSWSASQGAEEYRVSASSSRGDTASCLTSELNCTLSGIRCGTNYSAHVEAFKVTCSSGPSLAVAFKVGTNEDCLWYVDKNGTRHDAIDCPLVSFCCGDCWHRYCCLEAVRMITDREQKRCRLHGRSGVSLLSLLAGWI